MGGGAESDITELGEGIGENEFLGEAEQKDREAGGDFLLIKFGEIGAEELGDDFAGADNGAGDQMGKEGNERAVGSGAGRPHVSFVTIDQKGDLLEGEEADAKRQDSATVQPEEETGVFEPAEQSEIGPDAGDSEG